MTNLLSFLVSAAWTFVANVPLAAVVVAIALISIAWNSRAFLLVVFATVRGLLAALQVAIVRFAFLVWHLVIVPILGAIERVAIWIHDRILLPVYDLAYQFARFAARAILAAAVWVWHRLTPTTWLGLVIAAYIAGTLYTGFARSWGIDLAGWQTVLWQSQVVAAILLVAFVAADRWPGLDDEHRRAVFALIGIGPVVLYVGCALCGIDLWDYTWSLLGTTGLTVIVAVVALVLVIRVITDLEAGSRDEQSPPSQPTREPDTRPIVGRFRIPLNANPVYTAQQRDRCTYLAWAITNTYPARHTFEHREHLPDEPVMYEVALLNDFSQIGDLRWPPLNVSVYLDGEQAAFGVTWREFVTAWPWLARKVPPAGYDHVREIRHPDPVLPPAPVARALETPAPDTRRVCEGYRIPHMASVDRTELEQIGEGEYRYVFVDRNHAPDEPEMYTVYVCEWCNRPKPIYLTVFADGSHHTPLDVRISWREFVTAWPLFAKMILDEDRGGARD